MIVDFDHRALLHLLCAAVIYIGVYLLIWVLQRRRIVITTLTPGRAKAMMVVLVIPGAVLGFLSDSMDVYVVGGLLLGLTVLGLILIAKRLRSPSSYAALACLALTVVWEIIFQPLITVYGGPARGYVQWEQVVADLAGLALGVTVVWSCKTLFKVKSRNGLLL